MSKLQKLIEEAAAIAGNESKLAAALNVSRGNLSDWKHDRSPCPDKHVLAMARIAGKQPMQTALEVYKERLGKLASTLATGAAVTLVFGLTGGAPPAAAHGFTDLCTTMYRKVKSWRAAWRAGQYRAAPPETRPA